MIDSECKKQLANLKRSDFVRVNFSVWAVNICGGFLRDGITVIINLQNSHKVFIDGPGIKFEHGISSFDEGLEIAKTATFVDSSELNKTK